MSPGGEHSLDSVLVATVGGAFFLHDGLGASIAMAFGIGALAGVFLTPDLDLGHHSASPIHLPVRILFAPYSYLIPHRSFFSHWPILGTLGRLAYLALLATLLVAAGMLNATYVGLTEEGARAAYLLVVWDHSYQVDLPASWGQLLLVGIAGLGVSDALHWVRDVWPRNSRRAMWETWLRVPLLGRFV